MLDSFQTQTLCVWSTWYPDSLKNHPFKNETRDTNSSGTAAIHKSVVGRDELQLIFKSNSNKQWFRKLNDHGFPLKSKSIAQKGDATTSEIKYLCDED